MIGRLITVTTTVLAFAAAVICYNLLNKHVTGSSGMGWFEAGCSDEPGPGKANCAKVLASPYSYFPPKWPDRSDNRARLPTALFGLVYYSALFIWLIGIGRPSPDRRRWHLLPLLFIGFGLAGSVYFTWIMYRVLDEWCPWCLATHVLNLLIAVGFVLMWPRASMRSIADSATPSEGVESPIRRSSNPTFRAVFLTVLTIGLATYAHLNALGLKTWRQKALTANASYEAMLAAVNRIKGDSEKLFKNWQLSEKREIERRSDDPVRTPIASTDGPMLNVVVFSDFECPSCQRFAEFFEKRVPPLFDGRIRLTFKHYPIDQACNPRAGTTMHKFACLGASLAEAARTLKDNEAFWTVHDFLYAHRSDLAAGRITPERVAVLIGVEAAALREAAASSDFTERIRQDVEQARVCEIRGTPAVFVEGRQVDSLALLEIGFWDRLADMFWREARTPRPASTRVADPAATPGSPGPTSAP